ncbi:hypothetical protein [Candidatus Aquarickettsia rohweri]|uniref:Uncharacterized protein n=1 Tax=Candidatus Aquarickettsia rohweri TaxID=2602574 RepID=A0A429XSK4_9RICK|nr:hypothetical protein [Candidatus Aquarickettsia rohweri]RST70066.1 hypothetical protein EIC27_01965 [Candidatus Aquarickettsia rohweri]
MTLNTFIYKFIILFTISLIQTYAFENNKKDKKLEYHSIRCGKEIQKLFTKKDLDGILKLAPHLFRKSYLKNKTFDDLFDQKFVNSIINSEVSSEPVGWRGYMLDHGSIWYDYNGKCKIIAINGENNEKFNVPYVKGWEVNNKIICPRCLNYPNVYTTQEIKMIEKKITNNKLYNKKYNNKFKKCMISCNSLNNDSAAVEKDYLEYYLIRTIDPFICNKLTPSIKSKCLESYLIYNCQGGGTIGCLGGYSIYGLFYIDKINEYVISEVKYFGQDYGDMDTKIVGKFEILDEIDDMEQKWLSKDK